MAQKPKASKMATKEEKYLYPSRFGTHKMMVVDGEVAAKHWDDLKAKLKASVGFDGKDEKFDKEELPHFKLPFNEDCRLRDDPRVVVCQDEFGTYHTLKDRVDSNVSDPNRYRVERLGRLFEGTKEKKEDR